MIEKIRNIENSLDNKSYPESFFKRVAEVEQSMKEIGKVENIIQGEALLVRVAESKSQQLSELSVIRSAVIDLVGEKSGLVARASVLLQTLGEHVYQMKPEEIQTLVKESKDINAAEAFALIGILRTHLLIGNNDKPTKLMAIRDIGVAPGFEGKNIDVMMLDVCQDVFKSHGADLSIVSLLSSFEQNAVAEVSKDLTPKIRAKEQIDPEILSRMKRISESHLMKGMVFVEKINRISKNVARPVPLMPIAVLQSKESLLKAA